MVKLILKVLNEANAGKKNGLNEAKYNLLGWDKSGDRVFIKEVMKRQIK